MPFAERKGNPSASAGLETGARDGLRWTTVRASDFYGPGATEQSLFGTVRFLDPSLRGKAGEMLIGDIRPTPQLYIPRGFRTGPGGCSTGSPGPRAGHRSFTQRSHPQHAGGRGALFLRRAPLSPDQTGSPRGIALPGLFDPVIREVLEVLYQKEEPYVVDGGNFRAAFHMEPTPLEEGVKRTLEWYEPFRGGRAGSR